jgi:histidinol phosphatase-like PHP family hydrolase
MRETILPPDMHVHTNASWCAAREMSPWAIAGAAGTAGARIIGLADHLWLDPKRGTRPAAERLFRLRDEAFHCGSGASLRLGAEADCAPGLGVAGGETLRRLDFAVVSYHFADLRRGTRDWPTSPEKLAEIMVEGFRSVVEAPFVTIAGHPFFVPLRIMGRMPAVVTTRLSETFDRARRQAEPWLVLAARRGIALELNAKALGPLARRMLLPFFRDAAEIGCRFALSSDAHRLADIGETRALLSYADEIGVRKTSFLDVPGA